MGSTELERPLEAESLREIERSLHGKLRAHRLSPAFIERWGEDALQKAVIEYLRAVREGKTIENRDAFIVQAAFRRAIDELRREARHADGAAVDALLESGQVSAPASEELAIERVAVEELREAILSLPAEERQALSLHYFEELSDRRSAEILFCSERTFRRKLKDALKILALRLGVAPESDAPLAIEVGLAAWVSLEGARIVPRSGGWDQLIAAGDSVLHLPGRVLERGRDLLARVLASDTSEKLTTVVGGPAAKAGGACAGAVALCLATGTIGPGISGLNLDASDTSAPAARSAQHATPRQPSTRYQPSALSADQPTPVERHPAPKAASHAKAGGASKRQGEAHQVRAQASAAARLATETDESTSSTPPPETEEESTPPPESTPTAHSEEEAQAKQQFGAFK
jgi:RNA polymerase sigma factor (sigma-70 family)